MALVPAFLLVATPCRTPARLLSDRPHRQPLPPSEHRPRRGSGIRPEPVDALGVDRGRRGDAGAPVSTVRIDTAETDSVAAATCVHRRLRRPGLSPVRLAELVLFCPIHRDDAVNGGFPRVRLLEPSDCGRRPRPARRSLVYGALWLAITAVYVGGCRPGAGGWAALTIGWAITLTVVATLALQPVRAGSSASPIGGCSGPRQIRQGDRTARRHLGGHHELESLLPLMATARRWVGAAVGPSRYRAIQPADEREPVLTVPIVLREDRLGVVECGPKTNGGFTDEDKAVVPPGSSGCPCGTQRPVDHTTVRPGRRVGCVQGPIGAGGGGRTTGWSATSTTASNRTWWL